jgi:DNA-binding SARP family transcriptional activator/tetratricopeptide (TPR) repeat protein
VVPDDSISSPACDGVSTNGVSTTGPIRSINIGSTAGLERRIGGLEFRVLGPLEAIAEGGVTLDLGGPKQRAVLALLVLRANEVVPTGAIVDALWRDRPPRSAVGVVRTYASRLRQTLAAVSDTRLTSRPPGYVLETDVENVDAHRFEALVAQARREADAGDLDVASVSLGRALALWRGDVLADLADLDPVRPLATRLEEMRLVALEERVGADLALGRHAEVVGELGALCEEHPFRERLWGSLIVALYRSGQQTEALATYQRLRAALVDHAGVEPGPELRALERDVLDQADDLRWRGFVPRGDRPGAERPGEVPLQPALDHAPPHRELVGRAGERRVVMEWFDQARAGRFGAVLVGGPPGIGKTALVARCARDAHAAGAVVVMGRADEGAGVPFQPLGEAIGHWVLHSDAGERSLLGRADQETLGRIVPAIAGEAERRQPPLTSDGGADRQRLFEAIVRWVATLAAHRPAVVVLDDLHWADAATLVALRHLLRHPPAARALVLATYRDSEQELATVLAAAGGEPHVQRIELAGLPEAEVAELVRSETGRDLDEAGRRFAVRLGHTTGGNPLFVRETLRHLTERGAIDPGAGRWPSDRLLSAVGLPSAVTELIDQRLRGLPPATAAILQSASVLGDHVEVPVLSRVAGVQSIEVVDALEPALDAGLITATAAGPGRFTFSHSLVREAIVERLPPGRRARMHWQAGQAIAALSAAHPEPPVGEIARHLAAGVHAGEPAEAIAANVRAGHRALATLAFEDALDRFATATRLVESAGVTDDDLAYEAWLGLGQASAVVVEGERQGTGYLHAAAVARRRRWPDRLAYAAIGFATYSAVNGGPDPDGELTALRLTDEALAGLSDVPTVERCLLLALRTMNAVAREEVSEALALAASTLETAEALDDPTALASGLLARAWTLAGSPHPRELRETLHRALSLSDVSPIRVLLRYLLVPLLAVPPLQVGDRAGFASARRRIGGYPEIRDEHTAAHLRTWDAAVALAAGRFADAERLAAPSAADSPPRRLVGAFQVGVAAIERGSRAEGVSGAIEYLSSVPTAAAPRAGLALLLATAGDHTEAARHIETLRRQRRLDQLGWTAPITLRHLAEVAVHLGDRQLAADLLPVLTTYAGQLLVSLTAVTIEGAADRTIGQAFLVLGRHDEAIERLAAAHRLEQAFGADALAACTAYWHARALAERGAAGDREAARRIATRAAEQAGRLGMREREADAAALARRL